MPRPPTDKRDRVIRAATQAIYTRGFHVSTLSDIAAQADVPVGSVYYFFKTKEKLGKAVVDGHLAHYDAQKQAWDALSDDPRERLVAFVEMTLANKDALSQYGCPVATLVGELRKEGGYLAEHASAVFSRLLGWLETQFQALGLAEPASDAQHLLAAIEGATLLTHSFSDPAFVEREAARLTDWIRQLPAVSTP